MDIEALRAYCLNKRKVTESFPFDDVTLVFKVMGKMFAIMPLEKEQMISLKCDPDRAIKLRDRYAGVQPGWHLNKTHWNQVLLESDVDDKLIMELVDHSYDLIVAKFTRAMKADYLEDDLSK